MLFFQFRRNNNAPHLFVQIFVAIDVTLCLTFIDQTTFFYSIRKYNIRKILCTVLERSKQMLKSVMLTSHEYICLIKKYAIFS